MTTVIEGPSPQTTGAALAPPNTGRSDGGGARGGGEDARLPQGDGAPSATRFRNQADAVCAATAARTKAILARLEGSAQPLAPLKKLRVVWTKVRRGFGTAPAPPATVRGPS